MNLSPDLMFSLGNGLALLGWLALAASPPARGWSATVWRVTGTALPLLFALV